METQVQEWIDKAGAEIERLDLSDETIRMIVVGVVAFVLSFMVTRLFSRQKKSESDDGIYRGG